MKYALFLFPFYKQMYVVLLFYQLCLGSLGSWCDWVHLLVVTQFSLVANVTNT